jgi:N-glycosylase/DNA lyase
LNIEACPFNLDFTLCCGQVFRWEKKGEWWYGVVDNRPLRVRQTNNILEFHNVGEALVRRYFSLDHDLQRISSEIGKDAHVRKALEEFWGLRIIRQEPWECLISFVCATYKSVAAIRNMLQKLSARFGEKARYDGCDFYSFPSPKKLASATLKDLESCGLGYRAKYVKKTSERVNSGECELEVIRKMPYEQAKNVLQNLPGVGSKVADCILLFSMDKLEAYPVDVWVRRITMKYYSEHFPAAFVRKLSSKNSFSNSDYEKMNAFGRRYFGEYAGYAQEYLYHYERLNH